MEVRISECDGVGDGRVTFGLVVWGEELVCKWTCSEICGMGVAEMIEVEGMDELLSTESKWTSEGTDLQGIVLVEEVAPATLGSSAEMSRVSIAV